MNWYSPKETSQLLPKDLLNYARKFTKDEAEKYIKTLVSKVKQLISPTIDWNLATIQQMQEVAIKQAELDAQRQIAAAQWTYTPTWISGTAATDNSMWTTTNTITSLPAGAQWRATNL